MGNLQNNTNQYIYKIETDLQTRKQSCGYQWKKRGGEINKEYGINRYTLLYIK